MALDEDFLGAVAPLYVPRMGTERVAPLLYHLLHFARPRRVLEVGMGYTTPFIALALRELATLVPAEAASFDAKTEPYLGGARPLDDAWLLAPPRLAAPRFYEEPFEPSFVTVDDLRAADSSAGQVREVLRTLGLDDIVTVVDARLQDLRPRLPAGFLPFQFAWVDAWECLYFFDNFWADLDPDGGLLLMHYLLTYPEGNAVLEYFKATQQVRPDEIEIVSLLEPHKLSQNSLTLLRKVSRYTDPMYARANRMDYEGTVAAEVERTLARRRGTEPLSTRQVPDAGAP